MNKIVLLAKANIRKAKGQTAVLIALFLIASAMLNMGLIMMIGFGNFFERTVEELNTSEAYFILPAPLFNEDIEAYLQNHSEIEAFQINEGLNMPVTFDWRGEPFDGGVSIWNKDEHRELTQWKYVGERLSTVPDNAVFVPYTFEVVGEYELGDELVLTIEDEDFSFIIAGFTEVIYQDRMFLGDVLFVSSQQFQELPSEFSTILIFANGFENHAEALSDIRELASLPDPDSIDMRDDRFITGTDLSAMEDARLGMPAITSVMLIIFTIVIVAVCLLVIRFRITGSIEEDIQKIGSLQSVGYTSGQVALSLVFQYAAIAFLACLAGIIPAYFMLPTVSDVLAQQSGLLWRPDFDPAINLVVVAILTFIVVAVAFLAARRVRKITPVQALRGGLETHNFKRNYLPLERSRLPLTLALSSKSVLQGLRQSLTLLVILAATSFTAVVAVVLFYNSAVDLSAFEQVPGFERSNAMIILNPDEDTDLIRDEVAAHSDVWQAQFVDQENVHIEGIGSAGTIVMVDFETKVTRTVYEGIFPRYDNEIAIAGMISRMLDLDIGDEILLGHDETPYLITGLTQGMAGGSPITIYLTQDGKRRVTPDFEQSLLMVYLNDGVDAAEFVSEMEDVYAEQALFFADADAQFAEGVSGFASVLSAVGAAIVVIAGFVVILVLYFVLGSVVIRNRRDLGIQKAFGYTTMNLMNQMSIGFTLPIILGVALGSIVGAVGFNSLMSIGMAGMGVMTSSYIINPTWIIATAIGLVVLSYLTSMLITWRIRKVSAYALVTE